MTDRVASMALAAIPLSLLFSLPASAQEAASTVVPALPIASSASPLSLGGMFQVLLGLLLVLLAVLATAWLLKRFSLGQNVVGDAVRVLGGVALGPRERLVLVEVGETWLLLGVAPGRVNTLHTLPRPEISVKSEAPPTEAPFPAWLKRAMHSRS